jgi:hypothetical protein
MTHERRIGRNRLWPNLRYYASIFLNELMTIRHFTRILYCCTNALYAPGSAARSTDTLGHSNRLHGAEYFLRSYSRNTPPFKEHEVSLRAHNSPPPNRVSSQISRVHTLTRCLVKTHLTERDSEAVTLLTRNRKVLGSNRGRDNGYPSVFP